MDVLDERPLKVVEVAVVMLGAVDEGVRLLLLLLETEEAEAVLEETADVARELLKEDELDLILDGEDELLIEELDLVLEDEEESLVKAELGLRLDNEDVDLVELDELDLILDGEDELLIEELDLVLEDEEESLVEAELGLRLDNKDVDLVEVEEVCGTFDDEDEDLVDKIKAEELVFTLELGV